MATGWSVSPTFFNCRSQFDQPGDYSQGDINCDGHVGFEDFLGFSANFGKMSPRGGDTFGPGQARCQCTGAYRYADDAVWASRHWGLLRRKR